MAIDGLVVRDRSGPSFELIDGDGRSPVDSTIATQTSASYGIERQHGD